MIGATTAPTRPEGENTMPTRARLLHTVAVLAVATAALVGCGGGGEAPPTSAAPTSAAPTPEPSSPSPTPEPAADPPATLPTDCGALASEQTRAEAVGDMTLQSNGDGFVRPAPEGATLALGCDWIVGDATGMLLLISTADAAAVQAAVATLPAQGYSCQVSDDFGADFCDLPGSGENTEEMIVARDDVWIYLSTVNRNGRAFLSEIVSGIFG
jgi:hypothetical protein